MKKVSNFYLVFLFVDDCDLKTKEKEKLFNGEWLVLFRLLNLFNSYLLNHREKIYEGKHCRLHQMWLVALLTCE